MNGFIQWSEELEGRTDLVGDLIAALTWPIDVAQELKEMADGPAVVTDYASLLRAQQEYKVRKS